MTDCKNLLGSRKLAIVTMLLLLLLQHPTVTATVSRNISVAEHFVVDSSGGSGVQRVWVGDLDGNDNWPDVLVGDYGTDTIKRFISTNTPGGGFHATHNTIAVDALTVTGVVGADVNGDGQMDVVAALRDFATTNNGLAAWWGIDAADPTVVDDRVTFPSSSVGGPVHDIASGYLVGNDTVVDYVITMPTLRILETGDDGVTFTGTDVTGSSTSALYAYVAVGDLDGDGNMDLATLTTGGELEVFIYSTENPSLAYTKIVVATDRGIGGSLEVVDLDQDGQMDLLTGTLSGGKSQTWYQNDGEDPPSFSENVYATQVAGLTCYVSRAADIDLDGHLDIVVGTKTDGVHVLINNGIMNFSSTGLKTRAGHLINSLVIADMDLDGDQDVVVADQTDEQFIWLKLAVHCSAGYYVDQEVPVGDDSCTKCAPGTYNNGTSAFECISCPLGTASNVTAATNASVCTACSAGTYSNVTGARDCSPCAAGTFVAAEGSTDSDNCAECAPGYYSVAGASECTICPENTFGIETTGGTSCTACSSSLCSAEGSTSESDCGLCKLTISKVSGCTDNGLATEDCPTAGGVNITLNGSQFLTSAGLSAGDATTAYRNITIEVGARGCPIQGPVTNSQLNCTLPPGAGVGVTIVYSSTGGAEVSNKLSYTAPTVWSVSGCRDTNADADGGGHPSNGTSACSRTGGDTVTVSGHDFGPDEASVLVAGRLATTLSSNQTQVVVRMPVGSSYFQGVNVLQSNGQLSKARQLISYDPCGAGNTNVLNDTTGIFYCEQCAEGKYSTALEVFSCTTCPADSYCPEVAGDPVDCDDVLDGSASLDGSWLPRNCTCPDDTFVIADDTCTCPPGSYQFGSVCTDCPVNTYKDTNGPDSEDCLKCPDPNMESISGSTAIADCTCGDGYYLRKPDADGTRATECKKEWCGKGVNCNGTGLEEVTLPLRANYWRSAPGKEVYECPDDKKACMGTHGKKTKFDITTDRFYADDLCLKGHTGVMCQECVRNGSDSYYWDAGSNKCKECNTDGMATTFTILTLLVCFLLLCAVLEYACRGDDALVVRLLGTCAGILRDGAISSVRESEAGSASGIVTGTATNVANTKTDNAAEKHGANAVRWRTRLKIFVSFYQVLSSFPWILHVKFPQAFESFLDALNVTNLSMFRVIPLDCSTDHGLVVRVVIATLAPIVLVGILWAMFLVQSKHIPVSATDALAAMQMRYFSIVLLVAFLVLPSVSAQIFSVFSVAEVDGKHYLRVDYSVERGSPDGVFVRTWAGFMILVYPIGIPLWFWWLLWTRRDKLNPKMKATHVRMVPPLPSPNQRDAASLSPRQSEAQAASPRGFELLWQESIREETKDRVADAYRHMRDMLGQHRSFKPMNADNNEPDDGPYRWRPLVWLGDVWKIIRRWFEPDGYAPGLKDLVEEEKAVLRNMDQSLALVTFLYEPYKPSFYWWEVVETLRRLALTGLLVVLVEGSAAQVVVAMLIALAGIKLYNAQQPYLEAEDNALAELAGWETFFVLFAALLYRLDVPDDDGTSSALWSTLLILICLWGFLVICYNALYASAMRKGLADMFCRGNSTPSTATVSPAPVRRHSQSIYRVTSHHRSIAQNRSRSFDHQRRRNSSNRPTVKEQDSSLSLEIASSGAVESSREPEASL